MADTMLSFSDNSLATKFLSMDDLHRMCPAAFKSEPTNPNVSKRYVHANTSTVVEDLAKLGWYPTQAKQCRAKKNSSGIRSYHLIAFQNPNVYIEGPDGKTDSYLRIILQNSSDGFHSFKFMCGLYRCICSNGLCICDSQFESMTVRHINYDFNELRKVVATAIDNIPNVVNAMNTMKNTILNEEQKKAIATEVVKIRKNVKEKEKFNIDADTIMEILSPAREEDNADDLWTVFNVCQEKMIKGGFSAVGSKNKPRKQRSITSAKKDIDYNQRLWKYAYSFVTA